MIHSDLSLLIKSLSGNFVTSTSEFPWRLGGNGQFVFMNRGDRKNVFVDGGNWEFVFVNGSDGQVVAFGCETGFIGNPGQSEFLAFGRNPVGGSLVGVAVNILVLGGDVLTLRVLGVNDAGVDLFLGL